MNDLGVLHEFREKLIRTETPYLILASVYSELFGKKVQKAEWGFLRRLINLYGKWIVFESLIRASSNSNLDLERGIFPYISSVCRNVFEETKDLSLENKKREELKDSTQELINLFSKEPEPISIIERS